MFCRIHSMGVSGIDAFPVAVEVDISRSIPAFEMVGLPDAAVRESRDRVRSAMNNSGFTFPASRVLINLAPADIRKTGPVYDLPILMGILKATGQISFPEEEYVFVGELSLSGACTEISGILSMTIKAKEMGRKPFSFRRQMPLRPRWWMEFRLFLSTIFRSLQNSFRGLSRY